MGSRLPKHKGHLPTYKVDFIAKTEIFLEQMDGYLSDLSGYIIVTGVRHVTVLVTLTPFSRS